MIERTSFEQLIGTTVGVYHLEELIGHNELGPLFGARGDPPSSAFFLCLVAISPTMTPEARIVYYDRFQQQAGHIATLQHPYILPLIDYGFFSDMPYVVWPYIPPRSLSARLAQHGPVDALTVGRYLDQIAGALEYAHEHATLHRGLSTDCIYLQPDGGVVVADLGLRRMVELSREDGRPFPLHDNYEACAPEQILNRRIDTYTDVYALGAVTYRLLTGHAVFEARTPGERSQQHLHAHVPPLSAWRAGLPAGLDPLLARALAKEPERRCHQPGALANAYHETVAPNQVARVPFITASPISDGHEQVPSGPLGRAARVRSTAGAGRSRAPRLAARVAAAPAGGALRITPGSVAAPGAPSQLARNALLVGLALVLVAGGALALTSLSGRFGAAPQATGQAVFTDSQSGPSGNTDAVSIVIHDLAAPPSGYHYDAWITNSANEQIFALGTLTAKGDTFALNDPGDGQGGQAGTNLLARGDTLKITLEQGTVNLPVGKTVLSGTFPPQSMVHVRHLLVSYPETPGHIGLVVGLLEQAKLLSAQALALQSIMGGHDTTAVSCVSQSLVDIIEGAHGANYHPLPNECASHDVTATGDGYGLMGTNGYLATSSQHASYAATAPDSTSFMRIHASHVEIAATNIEGWLAIVDRD